MKRSAVRRSSIFGLATSVVLIGAVLAPASSVPDPGDPVPTLDLVFLMDGSGSIDSNDWTLQKQGYAAALADEQNFPLDGTVAVKNVFTSRKMMSENVGTTVAAYRAVRYGEPLVSRITTSRRTGSPSSMVIRLNVASLLVSIRSTTPLPWSKWIRPSTRIRSSITMVEAAAAESAPAEVSGSTRVTGR